MATLVTRVITLAILAASVVVMATTARTEYDLIYLLDEDFGQIHDMSFQDLYTYRYVLSVAAIGCAYTLVLISVAAIAVVQGQRIGGTGFAWFLIFMDVVLCALLTSGGAAGLGLVVDNQRINGKSFDSGHRKFYTSFDASCGLLLAAAVCTVVMIMISVSSK
ncbi:CASP-like protein 4D1 [Sorghum bicolor]|nr:CASP-like protein 4D1 [Sorghum bicolor]|eukprot:XP_021317779.1 CASP-like protein 4D1 [Sorghum bicolor]